MTRPSTERLFWADPGLLEFSATVLDVRPAGDDFVDIVVDRTAFYPEGGGQPDDRGELAGCGVVGVAEDDGEIVLHRVAVRADEAAASIAVGDRVNGRVDGVRRQDHRQQHSGQHLLSAILSVRFAAETVSFHLGPESCTIDIDRELVDTDLLAAEIEANRIIAGNRPVTPRFFTEEDLVREPLRKAPPAGVSRVRVLEIEGLDKTPCGGTHVDRTGDLQILSILGRERRKGALRVEFVCGGRAVAGARARFDSLRAVTSLLECSPADAEARVRRVVDDSKEAAREIRRLREELVGFRAERLAARAMDGRVVEMIDGASLEEASELARELARLGSSSALGVVFAGEAGLTLAVADESFDASELARELAPVLGAKGGGNRKFARLAAGSPERLPAVLESLRGRLAAGLASNRPA